MGTVAFRSFVSYIDKSREFYAAHGYERPYRWASNPEGPEFQLLPAALSQLRLGLVTTASLPRLSATPVVAKAPYAQAIRPAPQAMFTDDLSWDKEATHTRDTESFLPLARLDALVEQGRVGSLSERFYGVPTDYSQRRTIEQDAPAVLDLMRSDGVEVALLVPL